MQLAEDAHLSKPEGEWSCPYACQVLIPNAVIQIPGYLSLSMKIMSMSCQVLIPNAVIQIPSYLSLSMKIMSMRH
jgi:hypothetical protein